jgi:hypothetical protein
MGKEKTFRNNCLTERMCGMLSIDLAEEFKVKLVWYQHYVLMTNRWESSIETHTVDTLAERLEELYGWGAQNVRFHMYER